MQCMVKICLLHHGGLFSLQNMISEDPGHGHLNGELDTAPHGELQEELPEPQLGQVTALLKCLWNRKLIHESFYFSMLFMISV